MRLEFGNRSSTSSISMHTSYASSMVLFACRAERKAFFWTVLCVSTSRDLQARLNALPVLLKLDAGSLSRRERRMMRHDADSTYASGKAARGGSSNYVNSHPITARL